MRNKAFLICGSISILAAAQGGPCDGNYLTMPFGSCAAGETFVTCAADQVDSIVWSNGQVGSFVTGLTPGTYSYQAYHDGLVVATDSFEVQQLAWSITDINAYWMNGLKIGGWAAVPGCTSAWFGPCCSPQTDQTYVRLVQDGQTELATGTCMGCEELPCSGLMFHFFQVPTGHTYHVRLYDNACGQVVDDTTTIVAHACDNLTITCDVQGTSPGAATGAVHLLEVVPDPNEPLPLVAPVFGTAVLLRGPEGWEQVGETFAGAAPTSWTGLDTGYYRVVFTPDAGCNQVTHPVHVSVATSTGPEVAQKVPALRVGLTEDPRRIMLLGSPGVATQVVLHDALGRAVPIQRLADGSYSIGTAAPGTYVVRATVNGAIATTRFIVPR